MLDAIRAFLARRVAPTSASSRRVEAAPEIQVAACALLLELAHADGEFSDGERMRIEEALGRHFGLDGMATQELLALAADERRTSIDHFRFTRLINEQYDLGQKMVLVEVMWGVILADGHVADDEGYLVRKLGNLLNLEPGYLAQARRAATPPAPSAAPDVDLTTN
jgi:uncharacterized tellurite resistance protein B-like protein